MKTFSITDVGMVRQVNQDYVYMTDNSLGPLPNLFVVADGMGGHQAGDYASKYTVEVLKRELENTSEQDVERSACFGDQDSQQRDQSKKLPRILI